MERLSSNRSILHTLRTHAICSILQPKKFYFSRPFFIAWSLYAATYATANATDTSLDQLSRIREKSTSASLVATFSFLPTYVVNVSLGILKDIRFSQFYGHPDGRLKQPPPIPRLAYMAFLFRDSITISSSFTLAPQVASLVPDWITADPHTKRTVTQLALPALVQYVNTPFHMIALDVIARPQVATIAERSVAIRRGYMQSSSLRAARVLPAFGVGCIINTDLRASLHRRWMVR